VVMQNKHFREQRTGLWCCLNFLKNRVLYLFFSQPAPFCFIISLYFIAGTLALLGLYIKGDHMPDLDAMKVSMFRSSRTTNFHFIIRNI